jgi:hypothetical protein
MDVPDFTKNFRARISLVGTRLAFERMSGDCRVVCATCHAGGNVRYTTREAAASAACRDSARACSECGAR